MKRASLSIAPAQSKTESPDLTDRLLAREPAPKPRTPRRARKPTSVAPAPTEPASAPSIAQALTQSHGAVAALKAAAHEAPARYEIALRCRLDALAHHLQQVADFVESATR